VLFFLAFNPCDSLGLNRLIMKRLIRVLLIVACLCCFPKMSSGGGACL
jgi:hypothetical protein